MSTQAYPPFAVEETAPTRKRRRLALSCVECKSRKIKCDRLVPNCSSCIARGIQKRCRWGDERDEEDKLSYRQKSISPESDVDKVVEKVLKRLQGKQAPVSPPASIESPSSLHSGKGIPVHSGANIMKTTAFLPSRITPLDGRFSWPARKEVQIDVERVKTSVKALPSRQAVAKLLDLYLSELDPFRCAFNQVILRQQIDEFWQGVEELDVKDQSLIWPTDDKRSLPTQDESAAVSEGAPLMLTVMARQGLVALVFSLIYATLSSLHYSRKMEMGVFPASFSNEDVERWSDKFHQLSKLHLDLSDHIEKPTIWTLQVLFLQSVYCMDHRMMRTSQINVSVMLRLCVSLGLNRLGSAIDDARAMSEASSTKKKPAPSNPAETDEDGRGNVTSNSFGVIISSFEPGNLALRELGRKLWTMLVSADFTMGAHMDSHYITHDNINHTSAPSDLSDEEILSASAPSLLLNPRPNGVMSQNAFPACWQAIARAGRLQVELENTKGSPLPYKDVLRVDKEFQAAIKSFPQFYQYASPYSNLDDTSLPRPIVIQRNALHEQVQFRLLRLHRLYMGKGFRDPHYVASLNACVHAAKVITDASIEAERVVTHSRRMIGYQIHLLHAALVGHLVMMFEVGQREEEAKTGKLRSKNVYRLDDIQGAMDQLRMGIDVLRVHSSNSRDWPKGLDKLESFLEALKSNKTIFNNTTATTATSTPQSPRLAAADILASIPSSTHSNSVSTFSTPSTMLDSSSASFASTSLFDPTLLSSDSSSLWSSELNGGDLWSLNALFPDYATNSIDLVDALERVIWS